MIFSLLCFALVLQSVGMETLPFAWVTFLSFLPRKDNNKRRGKFVALSLFSSPEKVIAKGEGKLILIAQ